MKKLLVCWKKPLEFLEIKVDIKKLAKEFETLSPMDQAWQLRELAQEVTGCRETAELVYEAMQPWIEEQ
jgi:hypothetical protein